MKRVLVGLALIAVAGAVVAQPPYSSEEGRFRVKFPGTPKITEQTAKTGVGDLKVAIATYANSDGNVFMASYSDFPESATKPANHGTLFEGIRDGAKGSAGKITEEKVTTFGPDKLPAREYIIEKDKGKVIVKIRVVLRENRLYQFAVIGTATFVKSKDATAFLDSFELTK